MEQIQSGFPNAPGENHRVYGASDREFDGGYRPKPVKPPVSTDTEILQNPVRIVQCRLTSKQYPDSPPASPPPSPNTADTLRPITDGDHGSQGDHDDTVRGM
jgi:hypothetical protein